MHVFSLLVETKESYVYSFKIETSDLQWFTTIMIFYFRQLKPKTHDLWVGSSREGAESSPPFPKSSNYLLT